MRIMDAFWINSIGFVKVHNGFETKVYMGVAQGLNETYDTEYIAKHGQLVPTQLLTQFLELDSYNKQYVTE